MDTISAGSPKQPQQPMHGHPSVGARLVAAEQRQRAIENCADGPGRVERAVRILKDHLNGANLIARSAVRRNPRDFLSAQLDLAVRGDIEADHDAAERGFPRAGFSHHGNGFTRRERERHVAVRGDEPSPAMS